MQSLAGRSLLLLLLSVIAIGGSFAFLYSNVHSVQRASLDYRKFFDRPIAAAKEIQDLLHQAVGAAEQLAGLEADRWEEEAFQLLRSHREEIWDRRSKLAGTWESKKLLLPVFREAAFGQLNQKGRCEITQILTSRSRRLYRKKVLFPFDDYCHFLKQSPSQTYVSKLLGWFVRPQDQIPSLTEQPLLTKASLNPNRAVGGQTQYDGILRIGRIGKNGKFTLLALDYRHIYERLIHLQSYPREDVVFPDYQSGDYSYLIDPDGWIIAHPKLWDIKGYDRGTKKLVEPWNEKDLQTLPIRYTKDSSERIGFDVTNVLEIREMKEPLVRSFKSLSGLVRTRIFYPIHFAHGEYAEPGYFAILVHGLDNRDFYSRIEVFYQKVSHAIRDANLYALLTVLFLLISGTTFVLFYRHRIHRPIRNLTDEVEDLTSRVIKGEQDLDWNQDPKDPEEIDLLRKSLALLTDRIQDQGEKLIEQSVTAKTAEQALQIAHDIRSPASSLRLAINNLSLPQEDQEFIESIVLRIQDIADRLLEKGRGDLEEEAFQSEGLAELIEPVVREKQLETFPTDHTLELSYVHDGRDVKARVQPRMFQRVVSNLISNAIEALVDNGKVRVELGSDENYAHLRIRDNGVGIPKRKIDEVLKKGVSFGKKNGNGLGLYFSKKKVEDWGGELKLESIEGQGTWVAISLPRTVSLRTTPGLTSKMPGENISNKSELPK